MRSVLSIVVFGFLMVAAQVVPAQNGQLGRPDQPLTHRIMAIGDSITLGAGATGGYRAILEKRLKSVRYKFIFVGHSMENSQGMSFRRHEGHSSWSTKDVTDGRPGQPELGRLSTWLPWSKPDTLLIMTGTNDPIYLPKQDWAAKYEKLLNQVFAFNPDMRVVMISIPKSNNLVTGKSVAESVCYDIVKSAVARRRALGYSITFADTFTSFNTSNDLADAYHPNGAGYQKIADAVFAALMRL